MASNLFYGSVPVALTNMPSLATVDVSRNRFYGSLPDVLTKLAMTTYVPFAVCRTQSPLQTTSLLARGPLTGQLEGDLRSLKWLLVPLCCSDIWTCRTTC